MTRICRTCLGFIGPNILFYDLKAEPNSETKRIRSQLECIVPEMTLNIVQNVVICQDCMISLDIAYKFKQKCTEIEEQIYEYLLLPDSQNQSIDISLIASKRIKEEPHWRDGQNKDRNYQTKESEKQFLSVDTKCLEGFSSKSTVTIKYEEDSTIKIEEPDLTEYEPLLITDGLLEETMNDIECEDVGSVEIDELNLTNYDSVEIVNEITTTDECSLSITSNNNLTEEFYIVGGECNVSTPTNQLEQMHPYKKSLGDPDTVKSNTHNEDRNYSQLIRPCSVTLHYIADIIRGSFKQKNKIIKPKQKNKIIKPKQHEGDVFSASSRYFRACKSDSSHEKYLNRRKSERHKKSCLKDVTKANNKTSKEAKTRSESVNILHKHPKTDLKEFKNSKAETSFDGISCRLKEFCYKKQHNSKVSNCSLKWKFSLRSRSSTPQSNKKLFECSKCSYQTEVKINLVSHLITHANEKPFKCNFCKYRSAQKNNVHRHQLIHTGRKPYKCEICEFSTAWKQSLHTHVKTLH